MISKKRNDITKWIVPLTYHSELNIVFKKKIFFFSSCDDPVVRDESSAAEVGRLGGDQPGRESLADDLIY
jgi:hypothetical protein